MDKKIMVIGASGHGKVIADIAKRNGYTQIAFLDDDISIKDCNGYPVLGTSNDSNRYTDWHFFVAIGNAKIRQKIQSALSDSGKTIATLVHPCATIAEAVTIAEGTAVMAGAVINPAAKIGKGCIINTCASVDHDCEIGNFAHVSVGAHVAGTVKIGERTWLGIGSAVINNLQITADCIIGAGAVVVKNLSEPGTYIGVPAKKKKA